MVDTLYFACIIMDKDFKIVTLNCEGIKRSKDCVNSFLTLHSCDILCLQAIWMLVLYCIVLYYEALY